ncbi:hypothetical protein MKW94_029389 [Papaver nudicaule]|uniref:S-protein homolog n=1 Tax=Papaver nudicaule TaxID=74823 RepID=A0AA41RMU7_PAPNU|nr:hypothetical protein [Papaver nudicaule]MCL7023199.1 hypothetical protein [Papaver nudicaule]
MLIPSRKLRCVSLFSVVIFAVFVSECSSILDPIHASVMNYISEGVELHIHCQSKDTDFGDHTLSYGDEFTWNFRINLFRSTLYWCNMWWNDVDGKLVQGTYDMYKAKRDWDRCGNECHFYVRKDCVLGYIKEKEDFECVYSWPK